MARNDYSKAQRDEWQRGRIKSELERGAYQSTQKIDAFLGGKSLPKGKPQPSPFDKINRDLGNLNKQINQNIHASEATKKRPSKGTIQRAAAAGKTLFASQPSTCFTEVSWTDGVASLTFAHKTVMTVDIEMGLSEFLDFANADEGMGRRFNNDYYGA
jgi:hypothetical protein